MAILSIATSFIKSRYTQGVWASIHPHFLHRASRHRFQQDGASVHRATSTRTWLTTNRVRMFYEDKWPPNSPDMFAIEHLWPKVTHMLAGKGFVGKEALWVALQAAFATIPVHEVDHLYESMPSRLASLKRSHSLLDCPFPCPFITEATQKHLEALCPRSILS